MINKKQSDIAKKVYVNIDSPMIIPLMGVLIALIFGFFSADKFLWINTTYQIGDTSNQTIKSNQYIVFEHPAKTKAKKKEAAASVLVVYDHDSKMIDNIKTKIDHAFNAVENNKELSQHEIKALFEKNIDLEINQGAFNLLYENKFSEDLRSILKKIISQILENGVVGNKSLLMKEEKRGITLRDIHTGKETFVKKIRVFYGADQAKTMVRIIGDPLLKNASYNTVNLVVDLAQKLIRPNITINKNETQERIYQAVDNVAPVLFQINKGETIIRNGEVITPFHMSKLNALRDHSNKTQNMFDILGKTLSIFIFMAIIYLTFLKNYLNERSTPNKNIVFLTIIIIFNIILAKLFSFIPPIQIAGDSYILPDLAIRLSLPVASGVMVVCLFFGQYQAYAIAIISAFTCSLIFENNIQSLFLFFLINGIMATFWLKECRERQVFIKTGAKMALLNMIISPAFLLQSSQLSILEISFGIIFAALGGILSGILAGGISPLLEMMFGYFSDIKIMELSNPEQKLLRHLMLEAPGTYNHSMIVGTMAEAAAAEIGANSIIARAGGYYHDIGKLKKPMYFIENQRHGKNLHDKLSPSMSVLILTAHVKDGASLGKKYKLPQKVIDIICQHHGTGLIKFFYEKAKQKKDDQEPIEANFRYPGPKPQSREAAIVMLADITEAAARSLDNPSVSRIQGVVQKQINTCFSDSQLDECNLTLKDLHKIAKTFNKILSGIHHHRIKYIEDEKEELKKDGNSNSKQEKQNKDNRPGTDKQNNSYLKRLGL